MVWVGIPSLPPAVGLTWKYPKVNCGALLRELLSCNDGLCLQTILSDVSLNLKFFITSIPKPQNGGSGWIQTMLIMWVGIPPLPQLQAWLGKIPRWNVELCLELLRCNDGLCLQTILSDVSLNIKIYPNSPNPKLVAVGEFNCIDGLIQNPTAATSFELDLGDDSTETMRGFLLGIAKL